MTGPRSHLYRRLHFPRGVVYRRLGDLVDNLGHSEAMTELVTALDRLLTTVGCARLASGTGGAAVFAKVGEGVSRARSQSGSILLQPDEDAGGGAGATAAGGAGGHRYSDMATLQGLGQHDVMLLVRLWAAIESLLPQEAAPRQLNRRSCWGCNVGLGHALRCNTRTHTHAPPPPLPRC